MPGRHAIAVGFVLSLMAGGCASVSAQEFRGSISGIVADGSGGVLPGVTVVVTNVDTQIKQSAVTDAEGRYRVLYLNPSIYAIEAELSGFKKFAAQARIGVGDAARLDIVLQPGGLEEVVTVIAASSLLNTSSGISGTTIDATQIAELPLGDGTAYMLTRLAPGIMDSSDLHFARPADNGNLGGIVGNGVTGGNEFSIDGAPNMSNARGVGFSPPSDAIAEFKVQANAFDAQTGHTAGAVVNLALKSGTNALRGAFGYFNRDDARTATPLLTQRANGNKPTREYNRSTATLSGPVLKNRTFFMGSFEHLRDVQPEPTTYTVPTVKMRRGDFSEFGANAIYDPFTVTAAGVRSPFEGNTIPLDRINPIAAAYAQLYPLPNRPSTVANYFTNQLRPYDYNAGMGRLDHNLSNAHRLYGTAYWNKRQEDRYNWAQDAENAVNGGVINGIPVTRGFDYRTNLGVTAGYTAALSTSLLFDLRVSGARFGEWRDPADDIDPAVLGFSSTTLQLMRGYNYLPLFTIGSFSTTNENSTISSLGARRSDWSQGFDRPFETLSVQPTLTKVLGAHTARAGYDLRRQVWTITNAGFMGGRFAFTGAYTRLNNSAATNDRAQSWAQFLLGLPTAATGTVANPGGNISQFDTAAPGEFSQAMHGLFVQDDWRVNDRLTVNAGLRLEINAGMSEADNRNIAGFDFETPNPIAAAAAAAYQRSPIPELAASAFRVNGGLRFADGPVNHTIAKVLPRGAVAYMLDERTVLRGGAGLFSYDYFFENINQTGFSQATPVISTTDNGITFTGATLSNPIPNGQLIEAVGSANGLASQLGQNLGTLYQPEREAPYYTRWEGSVQRDFGRGWVGSLTYVGSRGSNLPVARQVNNLLPQYLSSSRSRDLTQEALLSANVTNPFAGLLPGSTINGATIQRQNLLRPYPQFGTFAVEAYDGIDRYNAGTIQVQKRFAKGSSITTQYTHSSLRDTLNYLNPQDGVLEDRVSPNDRPHRFSLGTVLRVPLGRDQRWGGGWNRAADALLGGWQLSTTYQYQSGAPLVWGASIYYSESCGDPRELKSFIGEQVQGGVGGLDVPGWDVSCFYFNDAAVQANGVASPALQRADQRIQLGNNVRYFPSTVAGVRTDDLHLLDVGLSKRFELPRGVRLQVRFEAINALDYTVLWNPNLDPRNANFGLINQDRNNPRDWQIGLKVTF